MSMHFAGVDKLIYTPLFILLGVFIILNYVRIHRAIKVLTHPLQQKNVFAFFSLRRQWVKTLLLLSSLVLLLIAFCQPQWGKKEEVVIQEGRDLLFVLDVSRSMLAEDMQPNRLEFAKLKMRNLLEQLPVDRVGLVLFAGSAFVQCPLTSDRAAFLMFLDQVDSHAITSGTTAIDAALQKSMELFQLGAQRKNKLTFLITDGEDFSQELTGVRKQAEELGITLFVLGVGTIDGAPVPKFDAQENKIGYETDEAGQVVLTKLNEPLLQEITKQLKGHYLHATYDDGDVLKMAKFVERYEKEKIDDKKVSLYEDQYYWFLGMAWLLLALEWVI